MRRIEADGTTLMRQASMTTQEDARMSSWRDLIPVHPAAELFPMMSTDELKALGEDIKANGMRVPITVLVGKNGAVLDGRNRLEALEIVGLDVPALYEAARNFKPRPELKVKYVSEPRPGSINVLAEETVDPWAYVISANFHRRHLSRSQKADLIAALLKAKPERSDNATAKLAKVSDKTVAAVRTKLEATSEIPKLGKRVGVDGEARSQPKGRVPLDDPSRPRARAPGSGMTRPQLPISGKLKAATEGNAIHTLFNSGLSEEAEASRTRQDVAHSLYNALNGAVRGMKHIPVFLREAFEKECWNTSVCLREADFSRQFRFMTLSTITTQPAWAPILAHCAGSSPTISSFCSYTIARASGLMCGPHIKRENFQQCRHDTSSAMPARRHPIPKRSARCSNG